MKPEERKATVVALDEYLRVRRQRLAELDRTKPTVPIKFGDKTFTLELNNGAIKRVFQETGYNILTQGVGGGALSDPIVYSSLLLNALKKHHPELTEEEVDEMADYQSYVYYQSCLAQAGKLFMPDMDDLDYERVTPEADTTTKDPT